MRKEEENLLTRAKVVLSDSDLRDIEQEGVAGEDPLFGEKIQKEYKELYNYILNQYGDDWLHPAHRLV